MARKTTSAKTNVKAESADSKRGDTQDTAVTTVMLVMTPQMAMDLIKAGVSWYGASYGTVAQELLKQVNSQAKLMPGQVE